MIVAHARPDGKEALKRRLIDGERVVAYYFRTIPGHGERTMSRRQMFWTPFGAALLCAALPSCPVARAADDPGKDEGKVAGIMFDRKDDYITVKADGEDEPVKYVLGANPDKALLDSLKVTFNACRVELTYKQEGDTRRLTSIKRQILKSSGIIAGTVVGVYNDFWVEV